MGNRFFTRNEILEEVGELTSITVRQTGTGTLLFSEFGARLIGLFPSVSDYNLLWTAHDLKSKIDCNSWLTGGERLWLAPQRDFFFENPRDFEGFRVSPEIDPGVYNHKGGLYYESIFSLLDCMRNRVYSESKVTRSFQPVEDPYPYGLPFAGVRITEYLSISTPQLDICPWTITMVNSCGPQNPGTALFPIKKNSSLLSYFDPVPPDRASVENGYARFLMDSKMALKLALSPENIVWENPAKILYVSPFPDSSRWFCTVKRSSDLPRNQENCVDVSSSDPTGLKGAIQAYNNFSEGHDKMLYGEIELQLKKGQTVGGKTECRATHELLGYSGSKDEILSLAGNILGTGEKPGIYC
ncbi:MAG: hypothetical protein GX556_02215 [Fibrobacter sp.]|nr:hypothetical protein [Fibrobacter sp.]